MRELYIIYAIGALLPALLLAKQPFVLALRARASRSRSRLRRAKNAANE